VHSQYITGKFLPGFYGKKGIKVPYFEGKRKKKAKFMRD
jgi:hypothetical protein